MLLPCLAALYLLPSCLQSTVLMAYRASSASNNCYSTMHLLKLQHKHRSN